MFRAEYIPIRLFFFFFIHTKEARACAEHVSSMPLLLLDMAEMSFPTRKLLMISYV